MNREDYKTLFFSTEGRIGRKLYIFGHFLVAIPFLIFVLYILFVPPEIQESIKIFLHTYKLGFLATHGIMIFGYGWLGISAWISIIFSIKRIHDLGYPEKRIGFIVFCNFSPILYPMLADELTYHEKTILGFISLLASVGNLTLMIKKSTPEDNIYGKSTRL